VCVSFTGIIGFIGLIAPHVVRLVIGEDYRFLIPLSAVIGALILLASDTVGRTVISPVIIPVGIITSIIGAPMFIYLLLKGGRSVRG
ncbi:MAG: iron chelate uptake ABC transporter family permease subunit, partial [Candidatus Methanomethyliaceae archaeon]|nr:iron chelate uptake ABC transporter family permease subunit [Candidatus Methanomethyliaceae archaeon]